MSMTMKAKTPNDLAAFACVSLGFIPTESVVMAGVEGMNMTARIDVPTDEGDITAMTDALLMPAMRNGVSAVIFVLFCEDREMAEKCWGSLQSEFVSQGIRVRASVLVRDGFWEAIDQPFGVRGPLDIANHPFMLQANVEQGRTVRTSRDDLKRELEARDTLDWLSVVFLPGVKVEQVHASFDACIAENRVLTDEEVRAYLSHTEGGRRDGITNYLAQARVEDRDMAALVSALCDATARAPEEFRSMAAAIYALAAYLQGDGARAWAGLDVSREIQSDNSLASLLAQMVDAAMPPTSLAQMWVDAITTTD